MRSFLFVPADSERKLARAADSGADALILDLEDAVSSANKAKARQMASDYLMSADQAGPQLIVRMNALDTDLWQDDLATVVPARPDAVMVPKTLSGAWIARVADYLGPLERKAGIEVGKTRLMNVATETATSMFNLGSYAGASERLFAMTWGAEDLAADLGAASNKDENGLYTGPYQLARTLCLIGAVAAGVIPVDGILKDFKDEAGLEREARAAARDGFTAKVAIHPAQVPIINRVFTPSPEDVAGAQAVVDAFRDAGDAGVVALDGVMLDRPHLRQAERLLERARRAGEG